MTAIKEVMSKFMKSNNNLDFTARINADNTIASQLEFILNNCSQKNSIRKQRESHRKKSRQTSFLKKKNLSTKNLMIPHLYKKYQKSSKRTEDSSRKSSENKTLRKSKIAQSLYLMSHQ